MTMDMLLDKEVARESLLTRLRASEPVRRLNAEKWDEAEVLVYAFSHLEESFTTFLRDLLPRAISDDTKGKELDDLLLDIGTQFLHVLYHIKDAKSYRYLWDLVSDEDPASR